jgi:hypothetical protein
MALTDQELTRLNEEGLIPGPQETEEEFTRRARFCLHLRQELKERVGTELPFQTEEEASEDILFEGISFTKQLYGISPEWIPIFFSNYQLSFWQGGCAWIFQLTEETPMAALMQLRQQFRRQQTYLALYHRKELLAHEVSHIGRMMFTEPRYEEILAYRSSFSTFRRWLGPLMQSSTESLCFILLLGFIILADFAFLALGTAAFYRGLLWIQVIPLLILFLAFIRLGWRQKKFKASLQQLRSLYQDEQMAHYVIYRLTDQEIDTFGTLSPDQIKHYMHQQKESSLRWRAILASYPLL